MLEPRLRGKICWIWSRLAREAVDEAQADFVVLLGDDIELRSGGWKGAIERRFVRMHEVCAMASRCVALRDQPAISCNARIVLSAQRSGLPFGAACVAFRDQAFPVFPTFPVLHRFHLEAFGGELLPQQFINQVCLSFVGCMVVK